MKTLYISVHCDPRGMCITYGERLNELGEFVTGRMGSLRDRVRVGDVSWVLEYVAEIANILKRERGLKLVNVVIVRVEGKLDVSVLFELEVGEG